MDRERAAGTTRRSHHSGLVWQGVRLKALAEGLRLDTRTVDVQVSRNGGGWAPISVTYRACREFTGWWQADGPLVRPSSARCVPMRRKLELTAVKVLPGRLHPGA